jgi:hypothetical protein
VEEGDGDVEEKVMSGKETVTAVVPVEDGSVLRPGSLLLRSLR